jgi:hypothetical protein
MHVSSTKIIHTNSFFGLRKVQEIFYFGDFQSFKFYLYLQYVANVRDAPDIVIFAQRNVAFFWYRFDQSLARIGEALLYSK